MRILLITREFPPFVLGGVAYHSYNLARSLISIGHEVTILMPDNSYPDKDNSKFNLNELDIVKIKHHNLPAPRIWFNKAVKKQLLQNDFFKKYDVIHSHEYIEFEGIHQNAILKIHTNLTEKPKNILENSPSGLKYRLAYQFAKMVLWPQEQKLEINSLNSSGKRIYVSKLTKNKYEDFYNLKDSNYNIIYNGVDSSLFNVRNQNEDSDLQNENYFLFVGSTEYRKGFDIISTCLSQINADSINFKVKVVGQFDLNDPQLWDKKYSDKIEFVGRTDQQKLLSLYQNAIALIHPARYEPFGNVVLESLACGTPVIISDENHCGAAEILTKDCGLKINPDRPAELTDAIQYMLNNHERFKSENCRNVAEKYTWERVARDTIKSYENK